MLRAQRAGAVRAADANKGRLAAFRKASRVRLERVQRGVLPQSRTAGTKRRMHVRHGALFVRATTRGALQSAFDARPRRLAVALVWGFSACFAWLVG
jgi:hypothetical protein